MIRDLLNGLGECAQILPEGARDRHHQAALQGDKAMQLHILGLVDHAHPAATELLDDAVMRDGFADQRKLGPPFGAHLRLHGRQVNEGVSR